MSATAHPDCCVVCLFWQEAIDQWRTRALAGIPGAFDREQHARQELAGHQDRAGSVEAPCESVTA
jgi:hypothetical protein